MQKVMGLVLVRTVNTPTTIPPHEISLLGKPALAYSREVLSSVCTKVLVQEVSNSCEDAGEMVEKGLGRLLQAVGTVASDTSMVIVHDALRPILTPNLVREVIKTVVSGDVPVATSPFIDSGLIRDPLLGRVAASLVAPIGFKIGTCRPLLPNGGRGIRTLGDVACAIATGGSTSLGVVRQGFLGGELFETMSLDESEALLSVLRNSGSLSRKSYRRWPRRVLLLGGSGGIGSACMRQLQDLNVPCSAPTRGELDLRKEKEFGCLNEFDAVIHCAAAYGVSAEEIMAVNFHSCLNLLRAAEAQRWVGRIVFLSSTAAAYGRSSAPVYSASKAALNSLVEAASDRLHGKGIQLNAIAPAKVATALQQRLNPGTPLDQMIDPGYVAAVVLETLASRTHGRIFYLRKGQDC